MGWMRGWPEPTLGPQEGRSALGFLRGALGGPPGPVLRWANPSSSGLHVLALVQHALPYDCPVPTTGHVGLSGRGCPGVIRHCQLLPSGQDTSCEALRKGKFWGSEGTLLVTLGQGGLGP